MDDTDHTLFPRFSAELVGTALKDTPVVMVTGPRQCGKTTLVRDLVAGNREFITMDDDTVLAAARSDPTGLVRGLDRTTIDEVQRVPTFSGPSRSRSMMSPGLPVSVDGLSQYPDSASGLREFSWPHGDREPSAPLAG